MLHQIFKTGMCVLIPSICISIPAHSADWKLDVSQVDTTNSKTSYDWSMLSIPLDERTLQTSNVLKSHSDRKASTKKGIIGRMIESGGPSTVGMTLSEKENHEIEQRRKILLAGIADNVVAHATMESKIPGLRFAGVGAYYENPMVNLVGFELLDLQAGALILPISINFDDNGGDFSKGQTLGFGVHAKSHKPFFFF